MAKKSFILYYNHRVIFENLTNEEAGELIKAIFDYEMYGLLPKDKFIKAIMIPIKQVLDENKDNYEKIVKRNQENGKKGGRTKTQENPVGSSGGKVNPKNLDIDIDTDIVIDNNNNISLNNKELLSINEELNNNTLTLDDIEYIENYL